ncbi:MAG: sporulation protein, partial [Acetatifactor sp.]|nr:sporulation protein [Acetatifactor sp.]
MANRKGAPGVVESLLQGMDSVLAAKTVVGQPVQVGDVTIVPLVDVSFGFAAGAGSN